MLFLSKKTLQGYLAEEDGTAPTDNPCLHNCIETRCLSCYEAGQTLSLPPGPKLNETLGLMYMICTLLKYWEYRLRQS